MPWTSHRIGLKVTARTVLDQLHIGQPTGLLKGQLWSRYGTLKLKSKSSQGRGHNEAYRAARW